MAEIETYMTKAAEEGKIPTTSGCGSPRSPPPVPYRLAQMSIKLTNEAPVGMRAGLRNSYNWVSQDMIDAVPLFEWRQLLYIMCYPTPWCKNVANSARSAGMSRTNSTSPISRVCAVLQNHTARWM